MANVRLTKSLCCAVVALTLAACAAKPENLARVAEREASQMPKTSESLTAFGRFELKQLTLNESIRTEKNKVEVSKQLEAKLQQSLTPLLAEWQASGASAANTRTLVIQPELVSLRVISGGARFWAGAWAGNSSVDMNLVLTDAAAGTSIAKVRIFRDADAMTGAWSIGKSDENLLDYIVSIARQYLVDNHQTDATTH